MNLRFKTIDISADTTDADLNKEIENLQLTMFFLLDISPQEKRLFIGYNADILETDKNQTMQF